MRQTFLTLVLQFEEALTRKQKIFFPVGGLTKADRAFLQSIYISAPPYQSTVDLSSFTDEKIQGYAIVLKIVAGKRSFTLCLKC